MINHIAASAALLASTVALVACSSDNNTSSQGSMGGSSSMGGSGGASGGSTSTAGGTAAMTNAHLRVAHLSPDAPAVDVCLRQHSSSASEPYTVGPVFKSLSVAAGLAYPQVSAYVDVPSAQYDVRIVAPNAANCSSSLAGLPDITDLPSLPADTYATVAAEGLLASDAGQKFGLHAYIDNHSVTSGKIKLRFVHASAGTPSVDVGIGTGSSFTALFSNVVFGAFGMGSGIDAQGYLETSPVSNVTIVARPTGTQTDALVIPGATIAAGGIVTAFAVGNAAGAPLKVQLCSDVDASKAPLSNCSLVP